LLPSTDPAIAGCVLDRAYGADLRSRLSFRILRASGWRVCMPIPVPLKCVIVFYPHTSNWDFVVGLLAKWALGVDFRWLGKHTLFRPPFARWFIRWGGIPVDRSNPAGVARDVARAFAEASDFRLVITPEGTRRRTDHWKSGFYRIAREAGVPLGLAFIDRRTRHIGIGAWMPCSGDATRDLAAMRAFYADKRGWDPSKAGDIRFRDSPPGHPSAVAER
jgi:1-acyl-sn-glycerol-3-phosphate acyltransferase